MDTRDIQIILASSSPRRQDMLKGLGLTFKVIVPEINEVPWEGERPAVFAVRAACDKGKWVADRLDKEGRYLVISGDTVVALGKKILGKPRDSGEARLMLNELSGTTHEVISGICVLLVEKGKISMEASHGVKTTVEFKLLTEDEIEAYIASGEPMDKAGAYAIQGGANYMVKRINGSHTNVIGLPLCELIEMLEKKFDYPVV